MQGLELPLATVNTGAPPPQLEGMPRWLDGWIGWRTRARCAAAGGSGACGDLPSARAVAPQYVPSPGPRLPCTAVGEFRQMAQWAQEEPGRLDQAGAAGRGGGLVAASARCGIPLPGHNGQGRARWCHTCPSSPSCHRTPATVPPPSVLLLKQGVPSLPRLLASATAEAGGPFSSSPAGFCYAEAGGPSSSSPVFPSPGEEDAEADQGVGRGARPRAEGTLLRTLMFCGTRG